MRGQLLLWVSAALAPVLAAAQAPSPTPAGQACERPDNRILGPRSSNRPLPLLSGDATRGFHPACTVPWRILSPRNEALPVTACFRGSLLRIPNDSACGSGTGPLWVSARWVMTSAELARPVLRAATCQQLDTGAWAGTRAFDFDCVPQKKDLKDEKVSAAANAHAPSSATGTTDRTGRTGQTAATAASTRAADTAPAGTRATQVGDPPPPQR
jgi:hypothetical protein